MCWPRVVDDGFGFEIRFVEFVLNLNPKWICLWIDDDFRFVNVLWFLVFLTSGKKCMNVLEDL